MLTFQVMGVWLLGLSWLTAALVALDALIDVRRVRALQRSWRDRLTVATVGAQGLAWHEVEQRVQLFEVPRPALGFFDRAHRWALVGGAAVLADGSPVRVEPSPDAEVWPDPSQQRAAAADEALWTSAASTRGALRVVRSEFVPGQRVWLSGTRAGEVLTAQLASAVDPRAWARSRLWLVTAVLALNVCWVAGGTALALWPPAFGLVSKLGAMVLLGHFLGITPLAMAVREALRLPSVAFVRGERQRPAGAPVTAS